MEENNSKSKKYEILKQVADAISEMNSLEANTKIYFQFLDRIVSIRSQQVPSFSQTLRSAFDYPGKSVSRQSTTIPTSPKKHKKPEDDNSLSRLEEMQLRLESKDVQDAVRNSENPKQAIQNIKKAEDEIKELVKLTDEDKLRIAKGECVDSTGLIIEKLAKARPGLDVEYESLAKKICRKDKGKRQALDVMHGYIDDLKELENFVISLQSPMSNAQIAEKMLNLMAREDKKRQEEIKGRHIIEAVLLFIPDGIWKDHNVPAVQAQIRKLLGSITKQDRDAARKK